MLGFASPRPSLPRRRSAFPRPSPRSNSSPSRPRSLSPNSLPRPSQGVTREAARLRKKRQDVAIEWEKLLRDQAYALKERIGEEFARVPENTGDMTLEEVLAHQESVKAGVAKAYEEMLRFAERYPKTVDPEMLAEVEDQKMVLDAKIAQVNAEIRTAKEIASRGKVVMPVIIGLFNPQPGSTAEAQKSRPAVFRSTGAK